MSAEQGRNCAVCTHDVCQPASLTSDESGFSNENGLWLNTKDKLFPTLLLRGLNHLRQQFLLCDVILVTGETEHPAHKAVLASISPYFKAMFSGNMGFVETAQLKIPLMDINSTLMEQILQYIYTAEIELTEDNVGDLLAASDFLNIDAILNLCCHFLYRIMSASNCIGIYLSAKAHNCTDLALAAKRHALEHFRDVVRKEEYLNLPFAELLAILKSNLLNTAGDVELLEAISKWVDYDPCERAHHLNSLLLEIDIWQAPIERSIFCPSSDSLGKGILKEGSVTNAINVADTVSMTYYVKAAIEKLLLTHRCDSPSIKNPLTSNYSTIAKRRRHIFEQEVIVAIGGESTGYVFNSMECFTFGYDSWKCSIPTAVATSGMATDSQVMPTMKVHRAFAAVCNTDYNIFVMGGINREKLVDVCEFYSVQSNEWSTLAPLPVAVHGSGAAYPNQVICIAGGKSQQKIESRCWVFEEKCNSWDTLPSMEYHRVHHGVASLNSVLFALGGIGGKEMKENYGYLASAECYNASLKSWIPVAPMNEPRAFFGVATVENYLYAIGGFNGTSWLRTMERYDPVANQWTTMTPMSAPRSSFGVAVWNGRIYVIGGTDGLHLLNTVEKFNPYTNRWHCSQAMQARRIGLGAATVKIPLKME